MPPTLANPKQPLVALSGVAKQFASGTVALDGLDLAIARGEFVSLLGPSGCGKSTALRLIAGLGAPSRGAIAWNGDTPGARRNGLEVGFVFQEPTLMPWSSVAHNVALPLELAGVPREAREKRVAAALEQVGLSGFRDAFPRELSGGMKMRVSLARALAAQPRLLLLDEPFAALDEITRNSLGDDLLRLWKEDGLTVLFVTHSVSESSYLSQRVLVMTPRPGSVAKDIALAFGRDSRLAPATIEAQRVINVALSDAMAA